VCALQASAASWATWKSLIDGRVGLNVHVYADEPDCDSVRRVCDLLREHGTGRVHEHDVAVGASHGLDGPVDDVHAKHHAAAAAVGRVVHGAVPADTEGAHVVDLDLEGAGAAGATDDALVQGPAAHGREER